MKQIPDYSEYYLDETGKIFSAISNRFIKPVVHSNGYCYVRLYSKQIRFHRLMLETYVGVCPKDMECCHNNGIRDDNRLSNLRWGTRSSNQKDRNKHGTTSVFPGVYRGVLNGMSRFTEYDIRMIIYMYKTKLFNQTEIAKVYDTSQTQIWYIINKRTWKHIWRYYNDKEFFK